MLPNDLKMYMVQKCNFTIIFFTAQLFTCNESSWIQAYYRTRATRKNEPNYTKSASACQRILIVESNYLLFIAINKQNTFYLGTKGQLILKGLFDVIVSTKKPMKFFKDFCPSL